MGLCSSAGENQRHTGMAWVVSSVNASRCVVVFHSLFPAARREGARLLGLAEEEVLCERKRDYDRFAEYGRVPAREMIKDGYRFDCAHCGLRIEADNPRTPLQNIVIDGDGEVFCTSKCAVAHAPVRLERNQRFEAFKLHLIERYRDLKFFDFEGGYPHRFDRARFEFPGATFPGTVQEVEQGLSWCISEIDAKAWEHYIEQVKQETSPM